MPQSLQRKLNVRHAQPWILFSGIQLDGVVFRQTGLSPKSTHVPDVKFFRLPGQQTLLNLHRKSIRIRRRAKSLTRENRRSLMMAVPVTVGAGKAGYQHVGPKGTNHSHHVPKRNIMALPLLERFRGILGKAKIRNPSEALLYAVVPEIGR